MVLPDENLGISIYGKVFICAKPQNYCKVMDRDAMPIKAVANVKGDDAVSGRLHSPMNSRHPYQSIQSTN